MKQEIIFSMKSPYRDTFRVHGYRFGEGEKSVAIVGAMRGDEVQQQFTCSQIVKNLIAIEAEGRIRPGHEILVIPSANHFSMNINKRFWAMDNTDINRMFPGYDKGETTQRIAAAIFGNVRGYRLGIQLASYYLPGKFVPHVSIMETGFQNVKLARKFGLPYVLLRKPKSYDTAVLNYNWQIFGTDAFSIYAGETSNIDKSTAKIAWLSVLRFLNNLRIIDHPSHEGFISYVLKDKDLTTIVSDEAGIFFPVCDSGNNIRKGDLLAKILDPFTGETRSEIAAPVDGLIFFSQQSPLVHQDTIMFKISTI